jgi:hypothetical protein
MFLLFFFFCSVGLEMAKRLRIFSREACNKESSSSHFSVLSLNCPEELLQIVTKLSQLVFVTVAF